MFLKNLRRLVFLICTCFLLPLTSRGDLWNTAYYAGYSAANLPVAEIDFTALTHIVHFSLVPNGDGSLDADLNSLTHTAITNLVTVTHAANKKVLICVGGANTYFPNAASIANAPTFVMNLTNFMATNGYDGIDVDWEPLPDEDGVLYTNLITRLRTALNAFTPPKLLCSAIPPSTTPSIIASVQSKLDQINLMTYDLSGPYDGWVTWFNSPIFDGGYTFPSVPGQRVPSIEGYVSHFATNGVPTNKLGIGLAFYAYVWAGGNDGANNGMQSPRQSWTIPPTNFFYTITYNELVSSNFSPSALHYDTVAQSAWIGVNGAGTNDMFISYDDIRACQAKVSYARNRGLGGVIIWELSHDHNTGQPDPLLQAVKQALASPGTLSIQPVGTNISLSFASMPLGSYRVQGSTNLSTSNWSTVLLTNLSLTATGGVIQVTDPGFANQSSRFYRVQTPP